MNPNHDEDGKFASGGGGGSALKVLSMKERLAMSPADRAKHHAAFMASAGVEIATAKARTANAKALTSDINKDRAKFKKAGKEKKVVMAAAFITRYGK